MNTIVQLAFLFFIIHLFQTGGMKPQAMDDGLIEVIGFGSAPNFASLQIGMTGVRICQCRKVNVITRKAVHCQVDGGM